MVGVVILFLSTELSLEFFPGPRCRGYVVHLGLSRCRSVHDENSVPTDADWGNEHAVRGYWVLVRGRLERDIHPVIGDLNTGFDQFRVFG